MRFVTSSYLDKKLSPLERVYRIWFVNFALRFWRFWMMCDDSYKLSLNFITLNSYLCAEINAHAMILILHQLQGQPAHLFMTWLFSSQSCESFFRASRSSSPVSSSQVNFTLKEALLNKFKHIDASMRITAQGVIDGINYPRDKRAFDSQVTSDSQAYEIYPLPNMKEIEETVLRAQKDVEKELNDLGNLIIITSRFLLVNFNPKQ